MPLQKGKSHLLIRCELTHDLVLCEVTLVEAVKRHTGITVRGGRGKQTGISVINRSLALKISIVAKGLTSKLARMSEAGQERDAASVTLTGLRCFQNDTVKDTATQLNAGLLKAAI